MSQDRDLGHPAFMSNAIAFLLQMYPETTAAKLRFPQEIATCHAFIEDYD